MGVTQHPQYSKTVLLKNPHVREICDFFGDSYNCQRGSTAVFKIAVFKIAVLEYCGI